MFQLILKNQTIVTRMRKKKNVVASTEKVRCHVAPWCLSEVWGRTWSKMRPDWQAPLEGKRRACGGRRVSAGTAVWLRAPSLLKLPRAYCVSYDKCGKTCPFLIDAWPRIRMHQWAEVLLRSGRTKGEGQWSNNSNCWAPARDGDTFPGWFTEAGSR